MYVVLALGLPQLHLVVVLKGCSLRAIWGTFLRLHPIPNISLGFFMQRSISVNIAGISIVFHAPQNWLDAIAERYGKFARREQSAHGHTVDIYLTHAPDIDRVLSWGLNFEPSPGAAFGLPVEGSPSAATIERREDGTVRPLSAHYDGLWDGKQLSLIHI